MLPGCATPSDMEKAIELGLEVVKFFSAETNGGLKAIKAMAAPIQHYVLCQREELILKI